MAFAVRKIFADGDRHAAGARHRLHAAIGVQLVRRVVAGVDVRHLPRRQVQHAIKDGDEHHLLVLFGQQVVQLANAQRGRGHKQRRGLEQRARDRHEQRGGHAFARDVGHDKPQVLVVEVEVVVKIAADFARRGDVAVQLHARVGGQFARQDAQLHLRGNLQFLL